MALTKFSFLGKLSLNCSSLLCSLSESSNQLTLFFLQQLSKNFQLYEMITKGFLLVYNCWYTMKNSFTLFPIPCEKIIMFSNCAVWYIKKNQIVATSNPTKTYFNIGWCCPYIRDMKNASISFPFKFSAPRFSLPFFGRIREISIKKIVKRCLYYWKSKHMFPTCKLLFPLGVL